MRVCGLKLYPPNYNKKQLVVTPYAGVWIETISCINSLTERHVTPYAGVWIETQTLCARRPPTRHTLCGCVD